MQPTLFPRLVHPASLPLGLYFRAGRNDHSALGQALSSGQRSFFGIVFEAWRLARHRELLHLSEKSNLECILDPCTQASATIGGYNKELGKLPWGVSRPHRPSDFEGANQRRIASAISQFAVENGFTQILAPTHLLKDADDDWFQLDIETFVRLRDQLDKTGGKNVGLIYSLSLPYAMFRDEESREKVIAGLERLPMQSLWFRVDGCGINSSPIAVRNYIEAAADFHQLGVPIVGDQVGGLVGLSLLALSAIGGMASGITIGERFNSQNWRRPPNPDSHMQHPRVYFPALDMYLKPKEAKSLFEESSRIKAHFGCSDPDCCPRGTIDMIENPSRHFLTQRMKQVSALGKIPEQIRPHQFVEQYVRPTTDYVLRLASFGQIDKDLQRRIMTHRKRLDAMRVMLGKLVDSSSTLTHSSIPATRAAREARL
jgi:hypothetical protein